MKSYYNLESSLPTLIVMWYEIFHIQRMKGEGFQMAKTRKCVLVVLIMQGHKHYICHTICYAT